MATQLFVASLAYSVTDDELRDFFAQAGTVTSAKVIMDRDSNRSKGFGFVEMASDEEAKSAIDMLNGKDLNGRAIIVNIARPREERPQRSFGGEGRDTGNRPRFSGKRY